MNWCTHISAWPCLHSTSLHLRTLHILITVYFTSLHISGWFLPHLHFALFISFSGGNVNYCENWGWWKGRNSWQATKQLRWRGKGVCLYSGNVRFKSHLGHFLRSIVIYFSHIRQVPLWPLPSTSFPIQHSLSSDAICSLSYWQHR
jgi:hypothetical protein